MLSFIKRCIIKLINLILSCVLYCISQLVGYIILIVSYFHSRFVEITNNAQAIRQTMYYLPLL